MTYTLGPRKAVTSFSNIGLSEGLSPHLKKPEDNAKGSSGGPGNITKTLVENITAISS